MNRLFEALTFVFVIAAKPASAESAVAYWTTYVIETAEPSETKVVQDSVATLAAKWKLKYVEPKPASGVEAAYTKGEAGFEGTFYVTVDSRSDLIAVEVAIDPRSPADHDKSHLLRADLERELSKQFPGRLKSMTVSRSTSQ